MERKITVAVSVLAIVVGILVIFGWYSDFVFLRGLVPGYPTMKISTAISFILSGAILLGIDNVRRGKANTPCFLLQMASICLLTIMGTFLIGQMISVQTGIEGLITSDDQLTESIEFPGRPSLFTMVNFMLIGLSGLLAGTDFTSSRRTIGMFARAVLIIGSVALLGYILGVPALYSFSPGISNGMAIHTSAMFILIGACAYYITKTDKKR